MTALQTCFSGVQPTGMPTLGNLLGAFLPFTQYMDAYRTFFCVVDLHAITVRQDPAELHANTLGVAAWYIASGLDPARCTLFVQSHVPAHSELGWLLNTFTQMGELERMTQFKDKSRQHAENINVGLFGYPVLMAADILLYNTHVVPVGDDQTQHVELCRDIATRFHGVYGPTFTVPKAINPVAATRVRDLQDPTKKMSKSRPGSGTVLLSDSAEEIVKKFKRAVTDSETEVAYDPLTRPGVANLLEIYAACRGVTPHAAVNDFVGVGYGAFKTTVADAVVSVLEPIQRHHARLMADPLELQRILAHGAATATATATPTLDRVRTAMGLVAKG